MLTSSMGRVDRSLLLKRTPAVPAATALSLEAFSGLPVARPLGDIPPGDALPRPRAPAKDRPSPGELLLRMRRARPATAGARGLAGRISPPPLYGESSSLVALVSRAGDSPIPSFRRAGEGDAFPSRDRGAYLDPLGLLLAGLRTRFFEGLRQTGDFGFPAGDCAAAPRCCFLCGLSSLAPAVADRRTFRLSSATTFSS